MFSIKKHPILAFGILATDIVAVLASFLIAYQIRFSGLIIPAHKGIPSFVAYLRAMVFVVPGYLIMFRAYQLYRPERHIRRVYELLNVIKAATMATVCLMAFTFIYREFSYSRVVLLLSWFLSCVFCCAGRYFLIQLEYFTRSRKDRDRVLIVGMTRSARDLIRWAKDNPHYGQEVVGILANNGAEQGKHLENVPILGVYSAFDDIVSHERSIPSLLPMLPLHEK